MCVYLTTVQVNLGPQSPVLCVSAKAHKPSDQRASFETWGQRNLLRKLQPSLSCSLKKKHMKVNWRVFFRRLLHEYSAQLLTSECCAVEKCSIWLTVLLVMCHWHLYLHMPTNINRLMEVQSPSGCVGGEVCHKTQNSSSVARAILSDFFPFLPAETFSPWTIKWKQHMSLGGHWKKLVADCSS